MNKFYEYGTLDFLKKEIEIHITLSRLERPMEYFRKPKFNLVTLKSPTSSVNRVFHSRFRYVRRISIELSLAPEKRKLTGTCLSEEDLCALE